ncbi:hypothetical protein F66182_8507 [Fusarium sp. NRRL 66182]|nr:hypothetical protein F66182_8507 [Fusarium sp. NRRL 66182]
MTPLHHLVLSALCLLPFTQGEYISTRSCKAYPSSSDWPSPKTWSQLDKSLGGRLLTPTPPGAVCHKGWPTYDPDTCPTAKEKWKAYEFHTEDPVSLIYDQYSNWTCLPDPKHPCSDRGYPAYVVNVTKAEHVKIGIDFARKHNVRLVVKNTGHDYMGRSVAPGSLSLWTHHLKDIAHHKGSFKLYNSKTTIPGDAVTAGAGAQMYDVYASLDKYGRTLVGGGGRSVGLGGYITAGGHSFLSPKYGLAADQVLQMTMVTPSGKVLTVNEDNHPDLFWAMRGGGGSTFGVLTSVTLKTYKTPKILSSYWTIGTDANAPFVHDMLAYAVSKFPSLADAGLSGYARMTPRIPNPTPAPGLPDEIGGIGGVFTALDVQDPSYIDKLLKPINETLQKRWPGAVLFTATTTQYSSFLEWYKIYYDTGAAGESNYIVSRLLTKESLEDDETALRDALKAGMVPSGGMMLHLVAGKGVRDARPRGGSISANPGWKKTYIHAVGGQSFPSFNRTAEVQAVENLIRIWDPVRKLSPETGAYLNEALPFEENWQRTFWGSNYERLLSIKKAVDPHHVFWCFPCVGSEGWEQEADGRLCRVDKLDLIQSDTIVGV